MDKEREIVFKADGEPYKLVPMNEVEEPVKRRGKKPRAEDGFIQLWSLEIRRRRGEVSTGAFWVFTILVELMDRKDGVVIYMLDDVRESAGLAHTSTTSKLIAELVTAGWVRRVRRSVVAVNPHLAWRGASEDRGTAMFRWNNNLPLRRVAR